ncbi:MAG: hypothetical protein ACK4RK_05090 [Gemmataceae bacterium]
MRRMCWGVLGGITVLLSVLGCQSNKPIFEKPELEEKYCLPPEEDPRYSNYIQYPKETLNQNLVRPDTSTLNPNPSMAPANPRNMPRGPSFGSSARPM